MFIQWEANFFAAYNHVSRAAIPASRCSYGQLFSVIIFPLCVSVYNIIFSGGRIIPFFRRGGDFLLFLYGANFCFFFLLFASSSSPCIVEHSTTFISLINIEDILAHKSFISLSFALLFHFFRAFLGAAGSARTKKKLVFFVESVTFEVISWCGIQESITTFCFLF